MTPPIASSVEVERKYDVPPDTPVPDLAGVGGAARVTDPERYQLEATYYDTDDLRLRAAGLTLRHRTGGSDAGWHLKLPAADGREELTVDAPPDEVPPALASLVRVRARTAPLVPRARLSTVRVVRRLLDENGTPLVEIADDEVVARGVPHGPELRWREWEAELLQGDRELLDAVEERLLAAGATASRSGSKSGRVLGSPPGRRFAAPWWSRADPRGGATAAATLHAHLAAQVAALQARDPEVRRDLPDAVHRMRVATRRLRSALATFRPLLERERTDPLRDELRWLAGALAPVRDAEVMHARLRALVDAEPPELVLGKVRDRIDTALTRQYRQAHDRLLAELDGERYFRLLDDLDALVDDPPLRPEADGPADRVLLRPMRRAWRRLDRATAQARRCPAGPRLEELLHEVRKDAKRVRYAAEALEPVVGGPARRFAKAVRGLQDELGALQDGVATRAVLRELGARGHLAGENGFTFGRLHALEQARAEAAADRWRSLWRQVSRRRLRRWFDD